MAKTDIEVKISADWAKMITDDVRAHFNRAVGHYVAATRWDLADMQALSEVSRPRRRRKKAARRVSAPALKPLRAME